MRLRFTLAVMLVTLVALATLLIPLAGYLRDVETDRILTTLQRDAFVLAGRSEEALETSEPEVTTITELAREYRDETGARVVIVDGAGTAIVTSDDDPGRVGDPYASRPEISEALGGDIATGVRHSTTLGIDLLYVAVPVLSGERVLGAVRLTYPAQVVTDAVNGKLASLGIAGLTTVAAAGVVGAILASGVTRRLRRLTELSEGFAEGRLDDRADPSSGAPELRSLARSFNTMAARLGESLDEQRRFASDAAHQLRTPITALRLRLDRARDLIGDGDAEGASDRIASALDEADRLDGMVEGLLALARSEGGMLRLEPTDLADVARDAIERWEPLASESGVALAAHVTPGLRPALTARAALDQILDNLIDNALSAGPGGSIDLEVRGGPEPSIHVLDRGPGLSTDRLARAGERSWTTKPDGTGLGLPIALRLARAAGARLALANREAGGFDAAVIVERFAPHRPGDRIGRHHDGPHAREEGAP